MRTRELSEREKWFTDRIGMRVYRNRTTCRCKTCENIWHNGIIIENTMHAKYLYDCESEFTAEEHPLRYFDTIEERDKYEVSLPIGINDPTLTLIC